ncbi:hypothetical protein Tco_1466166 [Tanacetum coccineum]
MVQTRNSDNNNPPALIATQLAAIATKLEAIETMKEDIAALKEGDQSRSRGSKNFDGESSWRGRQSYRPYNKIDFLIFSGGDPRGWLLKAKKYLRYYQIPDEEKVEIASMHLEGDAFERYSWLSDGQVIFWEELVQAFTQNFGLAEFQNRMSSFVALNKLVRYKNIDRSSLRDPLREAASYHDEGPQWLTREGGATVKEGPWYASFH